MKLYSAKVRLSGSLFNEVPLNDVTAAEIEVLNIIHGASNGEEAVMDITDTGKTCKEPQHKLRERLIEKYGKGIAGTKDKSGVPMTFESLFGNRNVPLPEAILSLEAAAKPARKPVAKAEPEAAPVVEAEAPKIEVTEFA